MTAAGQLHREHPNIRFPGQYFDAETGLHYNRFRYYSPDLGRYISSEPVGQLGIALRKGAANPMAAPDQRGQGRGFAGVHPYRYGGSNPAMSIDPLGDRFLAAGAFVVSAACAVGAAAVHLSSQSATADAIGDAIDARNAVAAISQLIGTVQGRLDDPDACLTAQERANLEANLATLQQAEEDLLSGLTDPLEDMVENSASAFLEEGLQVCAGTAAAIGVAALVLGP